ncbi:MAG: hypothetical protein AB7F41_04900 [Methylocystis sp.]|uniref:spike base protein, RCAP_Rcc01079 family n=1 Tax=Methylocystis sp. TaxID=1911079 RepID=UPI003D09812E
MLPDDFRLIAPAQRYVPVTKSDVAGLPDGPCKSLLVGQAGTANLVQTDGTLRENVPLPAGVVQLVTRGVRLGGTASDIWALY